jgi:hypothetical protein
MRGLFISVAPNVPAPPTPPPPSGNVFPQLALSTTYNSQNYNTVPANNAIIAQFGLIVLGGNFPGWTSYGITRNTLVSTLKGQPRSGLTAVKPLVFQYENGNEMWPQGNASNWFNEWTNAVYSNNWLVYNSGSTGTLTESVYNASLVLANPAHLVGTDPSTGLYPWALLAQLMYERYYLGTGSGGAAMASTLLDGYILDNETYRNLAGTAADWLRNGTNPSQTDPTATSTCTQGKRDYVTQLASLNPAVMAGANTEASYDCSATSGGGLGMTAANSGVYQAYPCGVQQFFWSSGNAVSNVFNFGGFAGAMNWYQILENYLTPGTNYPILTGTLTATDYTTMRQALTFVLMRNGWCQTAINGTNDSVDPAVNSQFPIFDEFWGGSLNLGGYLGNASNTSQGAEQSSAWLQGVWRRDFVNGVALHNPAGNGSQTVALGGTLYHLRGTQVPSINNGAAVTSVTIPAGDGLILLRSAPP